MTSKEIRDFIFTHKELTFEELKELVFWLKEDAVHKMHEAKTPEKVERYEGMRQAYYDIGHLLERVKSL